MMPIFDLKSADQAKTLSALIAMWGKGRPQLLQGRWIYYINEKKCTKPNFMVRPKSRVVALSQDAKPVELSLVWQNKELVIWNKPVGLSTQKTLKRDEENLYDQARYLLAHQQGFPNHLPYLGLHHRLDRDTSGLVLMTLKKSANAGVAELFRDHKIEKTYWAYTRFGSEAPPRSFSETGAIRRASTKPGIFKFEVGEGGDPAHTDFKLLRSQKDQWHLFECRPRTGRTHQIRVHLSHRGFPILGDRVYKGRGKDYRGRLLLHARGLQFNWRGETVRVELSPDWVEPQLNQVTD